MQGEAPFEELDRLDAGLQANVERAEKRRIGAVVEENTVVDGLPLRSRGGGAAAHASRFVHYDRLMPRVLEYPSPREPGALRPHDHHRRRIGPFGRVVRSATESPNHPVRDNLPVTQCDDSLGMSGNVLLVGYHEDGVAAAVELVEQLHDLGRGGAVEIFRGLVGEKDG